MKIIWFQIYSKKKKQPILLMLLLMLQSPEQASQQVPKVLSKPMVAVKSQKLVLAFNQRALSNWILRFP